MRFVVPIQILCSAWCVAGSFNHHVVHEKRAVPDRWQRISRMPSDSLIPLTIALVQQNLESTEDYLLSVSDPTSPQYAQYWTEEAVAAKFVASEATVQNVTDWLEESGIPRKNVQRSRTGSELHVDLTVNMAEQLLHTEFHLYEHEITTQTMVGCEEYQLSESVRSHVDFIRTTEPSLGRRGWARSIPDLQPDIPSGAMGLHYVEIENKVVSSLGSSSTQKASRMTTSTALPTGCDELITPDCLRALYSIPVDDTSHPANSLGIVHYGWMGYMEDDLDAFFNLFNPSMAGTRPAFESIAGGTIQSIVQSPVFNAEPSLNLEYAMSLTSPLNVTHFQVGDLIAQGTMNTFLAALDSTYCPAIDPKYDPIYPNPYPASPGFPSGYNSSDCGTHTTTKVVSISYAYEETDLSPAYERRQCLEFLKLGLQGITVIFPSGDHGTAGVHDTTCLQPGGHIATFPSTCPYVTSIGGTRLPTNGTVLDAEVAFEARINSTDGTQVNTLLSSGGGFSNVFPAPRYQHNALLDFQQIQSTEAAGRGFPDLALSADAHVTAVNGRFLKMYGTSASAPVFASIIAKINDARLRAGKQTVGFVNPALYAHPEVMGDVVEGLNYGCHGQPAYRASSGWDPVTGLGTPDFERMLELFMSLP
ncbi:Tripeptidyl-peptidase SED1 [Aspergillus karnatakaensis]|uniref:S53 family peptidase n=1 Tax=Aspergillus karnatakaensis TaxID=1810916 RepID=UPI003CCDD196